MISYYFKQTQKILLVKKMLLKTNLAILLFILSIIGLNAQKAYYVDATNGNDTYNGLHPAYLTGSDGPWKTIAKVNAAVFVAGDSVLFKRNDVWREQLIIDNSGTSGKPDVFDAYGAGNDPVVNGADLVSTVWTQGAGQAAEETGGNFVSGFETAALADWGTKSVNGSVTLVQATDSVRHGTYSLKVTGDGTDNGGVISSSITAMQDGDEYFFRVYLYVNSSDIKPNTQIRFHRMNAGGSQNAYASLFINASEIINSITINATSCGSGGLIFDHLSIDNWVMGEWNCVEYSLKRSATVGGGSVWINGVLKGSSYTANTSLLGAIDNIQLGTDAYAEGLKNGGSLWFDDYRFKINSQIGLFNPPGFPNYIWYTRLTTQPQMVYFNGTYGTIGAAKDKLSINQSWYWENDTLYVNSSTSPTTTYTNPGIEAGARTNCIQVNNASYVTLKHIVCKYSNSTGVETVSITNNLTLDSCTFEYNWWRGLIAGQNEQHDSGKVINCLARYNLEMGIGVHCNAHGWLIANNISHHNGWSKTSWQWTAGIKLWADRVSDWCSGITIEHNQSYNNGYDGANGDKGIGIWVDECVASAAHRNVVRYNISHDNNSTGIYSEKSDYVDAYYNICYNNMQGGKIETLYMGDLGVKASDARHADNNRFYNNVSYNSGDWGIYCGVYETGLHPQVNNNEFKNNIVIGAKRFQLCADPGGNNNGTNGTGNVYAYNCLGTEATNFIQWNYVAMSTYAAWETAYGSASHSINADPLFVNKTGYNFHLLTTSLCKNAGTNVNLTSDYDNQPVPMGSGVDVGAFEFIEGVVKYTLTVNSGTGGGSYSSGQVVNITANAPATGKVFDKWTGNTTGIVNINLSSTTITMSSANATITATYKDVIDLSDNENSNIDFYPNPVKDILNIRLNENAVLSVYDLNGVLQIQKQISGNTLQLDMSEFSSGIYIIKINNDQLSKIVKIIKE
jgi:hypothetical protein